MVRTLALVAAGALAAACAGASRTPPSEDPGVARARADSARYPYTEADIRFMSGMIGHHTQAIRMARWAPTHGASAAVVRLSERIVNAQTDEITLMQQWLRDRRQPVPAPDTAHAMAHAGMSHAGMTHAPLMPGMLTDDQLARLDAARGQEFDRLFLTFMIQHHNGALTMVQQLFGSHGAAQEDTIFKFASDVSADQSTEVARMQTMLAALSPETRSAR